MDRTESLSKLNLTSISLDSVKNRTMTGITVLSNGHLRFEFNRGEPIILQRNMRDVPLLNYIEAVEIKPFSLVIRTKDGSVYTHHRENEFISTADLPAILTQTISDLPVFKKLNVSGYLDNRAGQIVPNLGLNDLSQDIFLAYYYRTLYITMTAGAWRTVPFTTEVLSTPSPSGPRLVGNNIVVNKGRYLFNLIGSAGISSTSVCYAKYRLFDVTNNTILGHSPAIYAGQNNGFESSGGDFSCELEVLSDAVNLQLQFRCTVTCRMGVNVDWGIRNNFLLTKLD